MLKPKTRFIRLQNIPPAAFGRLCVETLGGIYDDADLTQPPSGGCVLKHCTGGFSREMTNQPPSGGCVLKLDCDAEEAKRLPSRLRAAVC